MKRTIVTRLLTLGVAMASTGALLTALPAAAAGDTSTTATVKQTVSDATITTKIKAAFAGDPQVSALNISVDTDNGVVKLSGQAKSKEEADKAVQLARSTEGVRSVQNQISVGSAKAKY